MKNVLKATVLMSMMGVVQVASASLITYEKLDSATWDAGNGHTYELFQKQDHGIPTHLTWNEANTQAQLAGGHLVTLTSQDENDFVFDALADKLALWRETSGWSAGPWIGASAAADEAWSWVTGEDFTYTNWIPGEPNGNDDSHNYARFSGQNGNGDKATFNSWDDVPDHGYSISKIYIVEYSNVSAVPVPAAAFLFAPALLGLMGLRRKAKSA